MAEVPPHMKPRLEQGRLIINQLVDGPTADIVAILESTKADFLAGLDGLSPEQIDFKPAEDRWTIREVALHTSHSMREIGGMNVELAAGNLRDPQPEGKPGQLDDDPGDWQKVIDLVSQGFDVVIHAARNVDSAAAPDDTRDHPWFGPFNCRQWAAFNIIHGRVHVDQLDKNKAADGYPG